MHNTGSIFSLAAGAAIGAAAMYLFDPVDGRRRQSLAYDKVTEAGKALRRSASVTARDLSNRSSGILAEARSRFSAREESDQVIEARVRSKLGFLVRHPAAITTEVINGRITLSGAVLSDEVQQLIGGVRSVRGVQSVHNQLDVRQDAHGVPGLQGDKPKPEGEAWDIMQRNWSPATRFLVSAAGALSAGLIAYALADGGRERRASGAGRRIAHSPAARPV